ncbi:hypothetical protein JKG47_17565 [Acidithiobacillus sp. MC6.1]|nr:hypothetical protein [Acidithiobacillus sp. MC6.1]
MSNGFVASDYARALWGMALEFGARAVLNVLALGALMVFILMLGWPVSYFGFDHSWMWGFHHLRFVFMAGFILGLPLFILTAFILITHDFIGDWGERLRNARYRRINRREKD